MNRSDTLENLKYMVLYKFKDKDVKENTLVGLLDGILDNSAKIKDELAAVDINSLFNQLTGKVEAYYSEGSKN